MSALFVAWQDPKSRSWVTVGKLTRDDQMYRFVYTRGATEAENFEPFGRMRDLNATYLSEELFPLFANRMLPKSRPEYADYMRWLGLSAHAEDDLEVLARSGGTRATDTLEIIPCPEPTEEEKYEAYFFSHGDRHLRPEDQARIRDLRPGEPLYLMRDVQNQHDTMALLLRTGDPIACVGCCPRYYAGDFSHLLDSAGAEQVTVTVEKVNLDAPTQYRLLCRLASPWPSDFSACTLEQFRPLAA